MGASVVSLLRNEITTQSLAGEGEGGGVIRKEKKINEQPKEIGSDYKGSFFSQRP